MNKDISKIALPLFIVWPFGAFILSLFDLKSKSSAIVYVLFSTVFAYSFHFQNESADSYRLALYFIEYSQATSVLETIKLFKEGRITDIYLTISYVVTKLFTNNPKVLFAWFGFIYGILSYLSLRLLIANKKNTSSGYLVIIAIVFFSFYPLSQVNGVRFNTGALMFFCSFVNVFVHNKKVWFVGLFSTILFHFSFIVVLPFVLLLWFLRPYFSNFNNSLNWVYWVFILSLIVSFVVPTNFFSLDFLKSSDLISSSVGWKLDRYNSEEATQLRADRLESSLFLNVSMYFGYLIKVFILFLVIYLKRNGNAIKLQSSLLSVYVICLIYISFGFLASTVPSGGRFLVIGYMLYFYVFYHIYDINRKIIPNWIILFLLPVFSLNILFTIGYLSIGLTDPSIWYGNIFWIIYKGIGYSLF